MRGENLDVFQTLPNHLPGQKEKDKGDYQSSHIAIWFGLRSNLF